MFSPFFLPSLPATSQHEVRATGQRLIKRKKRLLKGQAKIKTMHPAVTKDSTAGKHSLCMLSRFPFPFLHIISNVPSISVSATCLPSLYQQRAFHRCISNVPSIAVSETCQLHATRQSLVTRQVDRHAKEDPSAPPPPPPTLDNMSVPCNNTVFTDSKGEIPPPPPPPPPPLRATCQLSILHITIP